jgi:hypothetical protein
MWSAWQQEHGRSRSGGKHVDTFSQRHRVNATHWSTRGMAEKLADLVGLYLNPPAQAIPAAR